MRLELQEAGWLVTSKDAIKFGADFLLYNQTELHSLMAVKIGSTEVNLLDAQAFSRLCESVKKRALFALHDAATDKLTYVQVDRWKPFIA